MDGFSKEEEEHYNSHQDDFSGYVCPSDIFYERPKRALNTYGQWKVIVNLPEEVYAAGQGAGYEPYTQTMRIEYCHHPALPCSYISPYVRSFCVQKNNFIRLMAYTYEEGLHVDSFKLPVACSCHVE